MGHFFFLSYARLDSGDKLVRRFFDDLAGEVVATAGLRGGEGEAGFLDVDQPTGTTWARAISDALGACRVFVPLYSPSYFKSEVCGQEWHLFQRRLELHRRATGESLARILPVWFIPPPHQPPATAHLHDTRDKFDDDYRRYGLRYFMKLKDNESRYQDFLMRFARELVAAGDPVPPRLDGADLLAEPNAFTADPGTRPAPVAATGGPRRVTFLVATAGSTEMAAVRDVLDAYGPTWEDWNPFHPACPDPVLLRAQGVAHGQRLISSPHPVGAGLLDVLDAAEADHEAVVLLLDPWALGLDRYYDVLGRLDGRRYGNLAILVPGTQTDVPVLAGGPSVRELLGACLGNWVEGDARGFRQHLHTVEEFEDVLVQVLVDIRARLINRAAVNHRVRGGRATRPVLTGPEG